MGGAAGGVKFYLRLSNEPLRPGVLHWMAAHARKAGIMVRQVEGRDRSDQYGDRRRACRRPLDVRYLGRRFALMSEGPCMSAND